MTSPHTWVCSSSLYPSKMVSVRLFADEPLLQIPQEKKPA